MIKSMTGYGKSEAPAGNGRIVVEVRSVNHRYGEVYIKMPRTLLPFENEVRKAVSGRLKRGKIEVFIQMEKAAGSGTRPVLDIDMARSYLELFMRMKDALGLHDQVSLSLIAAQKDVLSQGEWEDAPDAALEELLSAVAGAVDNLDAMRVREGAALMEDLAARREFLAGTIAQVALRAPLVVAESARRLKERIELLAADSGVDEGRMAQEVAFIVDRCDITEELVRFDSHLQQFDETILMADQVGRKLDFLLQELNREINTIGSKANDAVITSCVVQLKAELEKIREQVQNIE